MNKKQLVFCLLVLVFIFAVSKVSNGQEQEEQPKNTTAQVLDYLEGNKGNSEGKVTILLAPVKPGGEVKEFTISPQEKAEYEAKAKKQNVLTKAAAEGDINTVKNLLSSGYDLNGEDEEAMTALMQAAKAGKKEMCEFLIDRGAKIEFVWKTPEQSALTLAVQSSDKDTLELLLLKSPDNVEKIVFGMSAIDRALGAAARYAKPEMVRYLVDKGATVDKEFLDGSCVLSRAVVSKNKEIVEFLLSRKVNVNPKANIKNPLMTAIGFGQTEIAKLLISGGADPNTVTAENKRTVLMEAAQTGDKEVLDLLISKGARLDEKDNYGSTALMVAGSAGQSEVAESLIMAGADLNIQDKHCETFLMIALKFHTMTIENFPKETIELAISKGTDVNIRSCGEGFFAGATPLILALSWPNKDIAELLIRKGADVNARISSGTILSLAVMNSPEEIVRLILDKGVDVNASSDDGITALMMAAFYGKKNIVELFLSRGADAALKDKEGNTAAMWAEKDNPFQRHLLDKTPVSIREEIADLLRSQEKRVGNN